MVTYRQKALGSVVRAAIGVRAVLYRVPGGDDIARLPEEAVHRIVGATNSRCPREFFSESTTSGTL
jgi:hypothetical protein